MKESQDDSNKGNLWKNIYAEQFLVKYVFWNIVEHRKNQNIIKKESFL